MKGKWYLLSLFLVIIPACFAADFNYSIIHKSYESICIGWGTPPFYDFSDGFFNSTNYVPYSGAIKNVDLNTQKIIMGDNLTMQHSTLITTNHPNCTGSPLPILWNTIDNSSEVATSRIGAGGTPNSALTFVKGVFKNGTSNIGATNYINFPQTINDSHLSGEVQINFSTSNPYTAIMYANDGVNGLYWYRYNDGNMYLDTTDASCYFALNVDAGNFHNYAFATNGSAPAGNRIKLFVDNVSQAVTCRWDGAWNGRIFTDIRLGTTGATNDATFDNVKLYNYTKTSFDISTEAPIALSCSPYNTTSGSVTNKSITYTSVMGGNFKMNSNLNISGCLIYNGGTLGNCLCDGCD